MLLASYAASGSSGPSGHMAARPKAGLALGVSRFAFHHKRIGYVMWAHACRSNSSNWDMPSASSMSASWLRRAASVWTRVRCSEFIPLAVNVFETSK